jgi:hypothetical protein
MSRHQGLRSEDRLEAGVRGSASGGDSHRHSPRARFSAVFVARDDGLAGSLNRPEVAGGYGKHGRGIGQCNRAALGRASRYD